MKSELTIVEEEHATIDKELGGRKDALTVQEQKLKVLYKVIEFLLCCGSYNITEASLFILYTYLRKK